MNVCESGKRGNEQEKGYWSYMLVVVSLINQGICMMIQEPNNDNKHNDSKYRTLYKTYRTMVRVNNIIKSRNTHAYSPKP